MSNIAIDDSKIPWLGVIPKTWSLTTISAFYSKAPGIPDRRKDGDIRKAPEKLKEVYFFFLGFRAGG